ncbi:MAG: hypothetical protein A2908_01645 [Candidatus Staskawiczbacteria bacterium RIFCSPLOWO2_01_FULL_38_12b]|uniref:Methyltransferase FkbM domain-containing protein n=1 Tax=Candidatus Staskawiczbacteria bacterium RIFCSPLOWO2_01_FULL_38_12b TaxID=1802214 RepID=A0A1G2ICV4_9BACT|nr:MAG: hypothetical protein A2908_01645 [Candidatus Staskawiczbacteria bacterium RIFCSPLOWO2_01_FULL_38_12b]
MKRFFEITSNLIGDFLKASHFLKEGKSVGILKRVKIFFLYLKFTLKDYIFVKILKKSINQENFLEYHIVFPSYNVFRFLFSEIFIQEEYFFKSEKVDPLIIDCGANIGISVLFFKFLYPKSKIIAFEPDDKNFAFLKKNAELNNLPDVEIKNLALSDKKGEITLYSDPVNPYLNTAIKGVISENRIIVKNVASVLLSDFINQEVDLLKIDIEGYEQKVLADIVEKSKLSMVKQIYIEYHAFSEKNSDITKFLNILEGRGFYCRVTGANNSIIYAFRDKNR